MIEIRMTKRKRSLKHYELTDHLGNVLTTISDRKKRLPGTTPAFEAVIETAQDYYPFGSLMPGRKYNAGEYRFGFNGQEKDDEIAGVTGSHLDFGARIYDSRVGRWLSLDPLQAKFPGLSPYGYCADNPILNKEIDGRDFEVSIIKNKDGSKTAIIKATIYTVSKKTTEQLKAGVSEWKKLDGQSIDFDGESMKVEFQIDVQQVEKIYDEDAAVANAKSSSTANAFLGTTHGDYIQSDKIKPEKGKVLAGLTTNGEIIGMARYNPDSYGEVPKAYAKDSKAVAHELGHIFGLDDNEGNGGAMDYDTYKQGPNIKDIQAIIDYSKTCSPDQKPHAKVSEDE